jgi:hypothetical protein
MDGSVYYKVCGQGQEVKGGSRLTSILLLIRLYRVAVFAILKFTSAVKHREGQTLSSAHSKGCRGD